MKNLIEIILRDYPYAFHLIRSLTRSYNPEAGLLQIFLTIDKTQQELITKISHSLSAAGFDVENEVGVGEYQYGPQWNEDLDECLCIEFRTN